MKYRVGLPAWLAKRGVSSLVVDQPGTGEALRLQSLPARFDSEHWASRIVDWLESRDDVDPRRIGLEGVSLGGYYCPRAVAFEPRFACGVAWGANHDWRDVQKKRLQKEGSFPVPHYWEHVRWVWGAQGPGRFHEHRRKGPSRRRRRANQGSLPRRAWRERLADSGALGAADLRPARQQPEARTEDFHRPRRRLAAFELRQLSSTPATTSPIGSPRLSAAVPRDRPASRKNANEDCRSGRA